LRKHFFLVAAVIAVLAMGVVGAMKFVFGKPAGEAAQMQGASASGGKGGKAGKGGGAGGRAAPVSVAIVAPHDFSDAFGAIGVAKARQSVTLTSDNTELITSVRFVSGQNVRAGDVLATLKSDEQKADVVNAQAAFNKAKADYVRWSQLADKGFASKAALDQYRAAQEQARANVEAAEARLRDRVIKAPFAGTVGLSDAAPGMLIQPGTPIATLDDLSVVRVDFDVPERYLSNVGVGTPMVATADAFQGQAFQGRIAKLDTRVKPDTRSVTARAEFPNPGARLKPGMMLKVTVQQGRRTAPAVPESAVQFSADQAFVFVIAERGDRTVAEQRTVTAGAREGGFVEIREGLNPGDRIVGDGLNRIQPGQTLKVVGGGRTQARAEARTQARAAA
jgi:membrane fusion protein (multidrug efflux system)